MYRIVSLCTLQFLLILYVLWSKLTALATGQGGKDGGGGEGSMVRKMYCTGPGSSCSQNYIWNSDWYGPVRNAFVAGKSITWESGRGWVLESNRFARIKSITNGDVKIQDVLIFYTKGTREKKWTWTFPSSGARIVEQTTTSPGSVRINPMSPSQVRELEKWEGEKLFC
jgi:hypothetical protein